MTRSSLLPQPRRTVPDLGPGATTVKNSQHWKEATRPSTWAWSTGEHLFSWSLPRDESADIPNQFRHVASSIQADVCFFFEHLPYLSFGGMSVRGIDFFICHSALTQSLSANRFIDVQKD